MNIFYFNHDFGQLIGSDIYAFLNDKSIDTEIGDWFFRKEAFPDETDNSNAYFIRYGNKLSEISQRINEFEELRKKLGSFLDELIINQTFEI